jgi:hypothetical protein
VPVCAGPLLLGVAGTLRASLAVDALSRCLLAATGIRSIILKGIMRKNQNSFAKRQREMEKKRKQKDKRERKELKKETPAVVDQVAIHPPADELAP